MRAAEMAKGYQLTPNSNPRHLYGNVLAAFDEGRLSNNGEPLGFLPFFGRSEVIRRRDSYTSFPASVSPRT